MITTANSVKTLADNLFNLDINPFSYLLTYKIGQDVLELLFNCIRGKLGFNNNPDVNQFKYAMRKIVLRVSLMPSKNGNCII